MRVRVPPLAPIIGESCMSKQEDVLKQAYGSMPREVGFTGSWDFIPVWRGLKYYWYKLVRKAIR
jgi:hypothetical protein